MQGQRIGYARVSAEDQNLGRQLEQLKAAQVDRIFSDKASGKNTEREELLALLSYVREGDTLVVCSMDRLARNVGDLRRLVDELNAKQIVVQFLKENLTFNGEDSPMSNLLLTMLGAVAEFERALIRERQMEGIAIAKAKGVYHGRSRSLTAVQVTEIKRRLEGDRRLKKSDVAKEYGISRETLYQYLRPS